MFHVFLYFGAMNCVGLCEKRGFDEICERSRVCTGKAVVGCHLELGIRELDTSWKVVSHKEPAFSPVAFLVVPFTYLFVKL